MMQVYIYHYEEKTKIQSRQKEESNGEEGGGERVHITERKTG